jgi:hypothetical protein
VSGLRKSISDGRLPESVKVYGPTEIAKGQAKVIIHSAKEDSEKLIEVVHELQRRRSIAKKDLFTLRVEPYSL